MNGRKTTEEKNVKNSFLLFLMMCFFPFSVLAWNTPGQDFSGELKLGGPVTSTRNPWVWKTGEGKSNLNVRQSPVSRSRDTVVPVSLPATEQECLLPEGVIQNPTLTMHRRQQYL